MPVTRLLHEMPASEFRAWAVYRERNGLVHRHSHLLLAQLAWSYACTHRGKNAEAPEFADFYPPVRTAEIDASGGRYSAENLKTIRSLKGRA